MGILSCVSKVIVLHYLLLFTIVTLLLRIILPPIPNPTESDVSYNPCGQFSSDLNNRVSNQPLVLLHATLLLPSEKTFQVTVCTMHFSVVNAIHPKLFGSTTLVFLSEPLLTGSIRLSRSLLLLLLLKGSWGFSIEFSSAHPLICRGCCGTCVSIRLSLHLMRLSRGQCWARRLTLRGRTSRGSDTVSYFGLTAGEESEGAIVWPSHRFRKPFLIPACPFQDGSPWLAAREKQRSQALRGRRRWGTNLQRGGGDGLRAR